MMITLTLFVRFILRSGAIILEPNNPKSREEAANILDAASNPGGPAWRSSTQSIATDDQALALHSDVNFSGAPLSLESKKL
ncbi:hypothetical protein SUGI_0567430 [Cryptomeria japonica]|nr:hypothetical protein SUGI_0567430 [Cryptomeria japonica]